MIIISHYYLHDGRDHDAGGESGGHAEDDHHSSDDMLPPLPLGSAELLLVCEDTTGGYAVSECWHHHATATCVRILATSIPLSESLSPPSSHHVVTTTYASNLRQYNQTITVTENGSKNPKPQKLKMFLMKSYR